MRQLGDGDGITCPVPTRQGQGQYEDKVKDTVKTRSRAVWRQGQGQCAVDLTGIQESVHAY